MAYYHIVLKRLIEMDNVFILILLGQKDEADLARVSYL